MSKVPFQVVYEDNHLIIVNKEAGVLVQGDRTGDKTLTDYVKDYLKEKYDKPGKVFVGVIHRIDRPVSGLVAMARTSKGLERMNALMRRKEIYKTYWAIVKKKPQEMSGKLTHWLIKDSKINKTTAYDEAKDGAQKAELYYKVKGTLNDHWLIEVNPITGRPHQIRVQLAAIGCPIRGDLKYGFRHPNQDASINLHARKLRFKHPVKQEDVVFFAGLPEDQFWEQFLTLETIKDKDLKQLG